MAELPKIAADLIAAAANESAAAVRELARAFLNCSTDFEKLRDKIHEAGVAALLAEDQPEQ